MAMNEKEYINKTIDMQQFKAYDVISQIEHLNLKQVIITTIDNKHVQIKEEYISGKTLSIFLKEDLIEIKQMYTYIIHLINGLEALHLNSIVHRDVKPDNIVVGDDGILRLIDYDISRIYNPIKAKDTMAFGTMGYAPPEQFGFSQSDYRTDIYALGVVLNEINLVYQLGIEPIINKCCDFNPNLRYKNTSELLIEYLNLIVHNSSNQEANFTHQENSNNKSQVSKSKLQQTQNIYYLIKNEFSVFKAEINILRGIELFFYIMSTVAIYDINYDTYLEVGAPVFYYRILLFIYICWLLLVIRLFTYYRWQYTFKRWVWWFVSYIGVCSIYEFILALGGYHG